MSYLHYLKNQPKGMRYTQDKDTVPIATKQECLDQLYEPYKACTKCPLATQGRTTIVFGAGNAQANLMFVGEGPGYHEDIQGLPFVGRSGKLLTNIINAMNLTREEVFISNVVKCRPPNNRAPLPEESSICTEILLFRQIDIIAPHIIVTLGASAAQGLLGQTTRLGSVRGAFQQCGNILVMPTYHPAYLLRNPQAKKLVWQDMQQVTQKLLQL